MTPADRAIVAAAEERDRNQLSLEHHQLATRDRRELLRIVRALEALLRERDTLAEADADDAAAATATKGRWR